MPYGWVAFKTVLHAFMAGLSLKQLYVPYGWVAFKTVLDALWVGRAYKTVLHALWLAGKSL